MSQIVMFQDKVHAAGANSVLKPPGYSKYLAWGFPDRSLRIISYDQDKLLSTHENLHDDGPVLCAGFSRDGRILVTGRMLSQMLFWHSFYVAHNHCEHANITESVLGDNFFGQFFGL